MSLFMKQIRCMLESADSLPSLEDFKNHRNALIPYIQEVYDSWEQDENGMDEELGTGGICQDIVDTIISHANNFGYELHSTFDQMTNHVYMIGVFKEGVYSIDIPYSIYEHGAGYQWTKIDGVKFEADHFDFQLLDNNSENIDNYLDN